MSVLRDAAMVMRLTRDFRSFCATPFTRSAAVATVKRQLATRDERFLHVIEHMVFRHPPSPYRNLLQAAGCELGDVVALVAEEGLEGALLKLAAAGVYVTIDELKGRKDAIRGSQRFTFAESDFDNPTVSSHMETRTGGTRGPATVLKLDLAFVADRALGTALAHETHGLTGHDGAIWQIGGLRPLLQYMKAGHPLMAWFYPVEPVPLASRAVVRMLALLGKLYGQSVPTPEFLDIGDPGRMATWLASRVRAGKPVCLTTYASSAVRVCAAATTMGLDLRGVAFIVIGEPFTPARRKVVEDAGAYAVVGYGFNEAGTVGFGCRTGRESDDVHLFSNLYALVQQARTVGASDSTVDAFLVTSLLDAGPKVLLNAESGDYGVVEQRSCGCLLGELGLHTHLAEIRSYEKLTTEGMTFVHSELLPILEEVLPARFGGSSLDYQLVEEVADGALARLVLIVSPRVGAVDETLLRDTFLQELGRDGWSERLMAGVWQRAGSLIVRRQEPIRTNAGKVLPFSVSPTARSAAPRDPA